MVNLKNGGYEDIVIAINPNVTENLQIITNIQNMVKDASNYLFTATKQRIFIRSVKILIPVTWSENSTYGRLRTETYDKADVIIANPFLKYGEDPYTLQYGGCGEQGRYIHFTPKFMLDDTKISIYGPRGRVFVHEWAHLRWGVFDEYNNDMPFYFSGNGGIEATRCSLDITGKNIIQRCIGASCTTTSCNSDPQTGLYEDGCSFVLDKKQVAPESIMYLQSLSSITQFCNASNHNAEAPNLQNRVCNSSSSWDVIMRSKDIQSTSPRPNTVIPSPLFSLLRYRDRVVTLVLDVSGSMGGSGRIGRLYQAAELFVIQIIETNSRVGIVKFESSASVVSNLQKIADKKDRENLKKLLPNTAGGGTNICSGILSGFQVNKQFDGSTEGTELVLLSDGEDNLDTKLCFPDIIASGAIIHVISLGPNEAAAVTELKKLTGGITFLASDKLDTNGLIDAFSAILAQDGDTAKQSIQLESTALNLRPNACLNGTVYIDSTVGNETFFLSTWQSSVPDINLRDPNGKIYTSTNFLNDSTSKSSRLEIPGTAESGAWHYSICNKYTSNQVLGITVNSRASDETVPPIIVNAHMNVDTNQFPSPMVVYAAVSQGMVPVQGVKVTAIVEPVSGSPETLALLDNGAGADIVKNDGIYSRYFFNFSGNGRYSLKVRVESKDNKSRLALPKSRALYIPGYVENGEIFMNPPRPVVSDDDLQNNLGPFSRTASGGSFVVTNVPTGPKPDIYPPEKITDLLAKIEEDSIVLSWTATGDDLDQGTASTYDLRMSTNPKDLRDSFDSSTPVNVSSLAPQPAGSSETFAFIPENVVIENGTILYFAMVAFDKASQKSGLSNVAQAALLIPAATPTIVPTTSRLPTNDNSGKINITHLALIICGSIVLVSIIISITVCIVSCKKSKKSKKNPEMKL
ncbi:calcium-activated chloride channel regulator 1-like [Discoglossus pictus]